MGLVGPLRYLIGADSDQQLTGVAGEIIEVGYDVRDVPHLGTAIKYCNLLDEKHSGDYGPYLKMTGTAKQYNEYVPDPDQEGFQDNLDDQFERADHDGFAYVELDNPDDKHFKFKHLKMAVDLAESYGLKVIFKNPLVIDYDVKELIAHPNVYGIIVEKDAGNPVQMDKLRRDAGKQFLPVWFVSFGDGKRWTQDIAIDAAHYKNMGVTYSSDGEYGNCVDILRPIAV